MADAFDGLVIRITDLCTRREKAKQSIASDDTYITDLTRNLEAAQARKRRHVEKLETLNGRSSLVGNGEIDHVDDMSGASMDDIASQATTHGDPDDNECTTAHNRSAVHQDFPTVIQVNEVWCELKCRTCGTNTNATDSKFFNGSESFFRHAYLVHKARVVKAQIVQYCTVRQISDRDADLLRSGQQARDFKIIKAVPQQALHTQRSTTHAADAGGTVANRTSSVGGLRQIHADYPTVVKLNGKWVELTCLICGCNTNWSGNRFLAGPSGFVGYSQRGHHLPCSIDDLTACCALREVSNGDVALLKSGAQARDHLIKLVLPTRPHALAAHVSHPPAQLQSIHANFAVVVYHNDAWVELSCRRCNANYNAGWGRYMKGAKGIRDHMRRAHGTSAQVPDIEQYSNIRPVSDRDRDLLLQGQNGVDSLIRPSLPTKHISGGLAGALVPESSKRRGETQIETPTDSDSAVSVREGAHPPKRLRTVSGVLVDDIEADEIKREEGENDWNSSDDE
ncbi:hypothetical protein LTR95_012616 [Oleoguttula sp. CCFEE 5521]